MPHRPEKLLQDVLDAGAAIQSFVAGRTLDHYGMDVMLRSAVERQFEIIGEALRRLATIEPKLATRIDEHQRIIAFRNIIAHGYEVLDDATVWQAVQDKLPRLISQAEAVLREIKNRS